MLLGRNCIAAVSPGEPPTHAGYGARKTTGAGGRKMYQHQILAMVFNLTVSIGDAGIKMQIESSQYAETPAQPEILPHPPAQPEIPAQQPVEPEIPLQPIPPATPAQPAPIAIFRQ